MRSAGLEGAIGDSRPATPTEPAYWRPATPAGRGSWRRASLLS
jgi:hypothetical protein